MANWLVWHVGISLITARQYVLVAHKLEDFPLLAAEFAAGRVSYSRVRALCRFITSESEVDLVRLARFTVAPQLERMAAAFERVERQRNPGAAGDQSERRDLMLIQEDEGTWIIRGRLPADLGTVLSNAMQMEMAQQRSDDSAASRNTDRRGIRENDSIASPKTGRDETGNNDSAASLLADRTAAQRRVDALLALVERGHLSRTASTEPTPSEGPQPTRPLIVIHRFPDGDELQNGPAIDPAMADRYSCDADIIEAIHPPKSTDPADVAGGAQQNGKHAEPGIAYGRRHRTPKPSLRRFIAERDCSCRHPGCNRTANLHAHHIHHWASGGPTTAENLVMLCDEHHRLVHEHNWTISGSPSSELRFHRPGLRPTHAYDGDLERLIGDVTGPITPVLHGDRFDLGYIVSTFLHNNEIALAKAAAKKLATNGDAPNVSENAAA